MGFDQINRLNLKLYEPYRRRRRRLLHKDVLVLVRRQRRRRFQYSQLGTTLNGRPSLKKMDFSSCENYFCIACGHRIAHRQWKETKKEPGAAGPGNRLVCCLVSFYYLWAILCQHAVWDDNCETQPTTILY